MSHEGSKSHGTEAARPSAALPRRMPVMKLRDLFRSWRRGLKARLPFVRRREYRLLRQRFDAVIEGLGWLAVPATQARIEVLHPLDVAGAEEVCFFVSHAAQPRLKPHVAHHLEQLARAGLRVVLVLNTDLPSAAFVLDPGLVARLGGVFVRENTGFDFAAWAHLHALCRTTAAWKRLFLVNDSIAGPIDLGDFDAMLAHIRVMDADVVALTRSAEPVPHLQSFFLVFQRRALKSEVLRDFFARVVSLPDKSQVIDVYEARLTRMLERGNLRCESVFPPLSADPLSSNDTSLRWKELLGAGFPYVKVSVIDRHRADRDMVATVPAAWRPERR